jgi:NAD(P)-dependent dehydrogenase (short-subunit alcohol dehydrogenase family)
LLDVQEGPGQAAASALGANAGFAKCDVTSETEVNAAMDTAAKNLGGINLLVNCAGVIGAGRVLGKNGPMAGDFFTRVVMINLVGTFLCDKAAAAIMQGNAPGADGERGVIIHTSSVAAFEGQIGQAAYSATKAAVSGMTLPIAREFAAFGIRVCSLAPGIFATPMLGAMPQELALSPQTLMNLPPRIRMATLYAVSQSLNGRVVNTCNLSEDWVGYSTRYGDAAGDFSPMANLTVTEVKEIGRVLGLPDVLVDKTPIDGLCGKTDEENLGFTYAELDIYIRTGVIEDSVKKELIDGKHKANLFKLKPMPTFLPKSF